MWIENSRKLYKNMLKNRLITVLFLKNGYLVRSEDFKVHQNLGNPFTQVDRYNSWDVDELIYIDITADDTYDAGRDDLGIKTPNSIFEIITEVSKKCFMPLTIGGGIRNLEDIRKRLRLGADKVIINTAAVNDLSFVREAANEFGSQCIVVCIDVFKDEFGGYKVYSEYGRKDTGMNPVEWVRKVQGAGAGEVLLNSINNDGKACGYDLDLIRSIVDVTKIPVIALGGVGREMDFVKGLEAGASAVAAGNYFHFKEMSYVLAKRKLKKSNCNVR